MSNSHMDPNPQPSSSRRSRTLLAILLALLLVGGAGGALWLRYGTGRTASTEPAADAGKAQQMQRPACSDDDDPKYLEQLEFGPPIQVDFDRRWLSALAERPIPEIEVYPWQPEGLVAVLGEHRMRGTVFAVSPDGKTLAIGSPGNAHVRLGPVDTIHEKRLLPCPGGVHALTWSADGDMLAASCGDGVVRLFDVRKPEKMQEAVALEKTGTQITSLSYSGDGKYLLGGDPTPKRGTAWLWDVSMRKIARQLKHIGPVTSVALSPLPGDYRALTAGGAEDGQLHLWDALAGKELAAIDFRPSKTDRTASVGQVAFARDGKRALSCHPDASVRLWDLDHFEKERVLHTLKGHAGGGSPVAAFSPDSQFVATGRLADGGVWLWSTRDGKQVRRLATTGGIYALGFLPGGDRLAFTGTISNDQNIHIHEVETGKEVNAPIGHLTALTSVAVAPQGRLVASGGHDLSMRLWDLETVRQRHSISVGQVWGVGFHPDGKRALSYGASSGILAFTDVESGQARTPRYNHQHSGAVYSAAVTRDGRYAVTGGNSDNTVRMWRLQDGRQVRLFDVGRNQGPGGVTVAPDMRRAIRVGGTKARLLHLRCQEVKHEWPSVAAAPFVPDGRAVFLGGKDAPVWKITADGVEESGRFNLNLSGMMAASVSADGKRVAVLLGGRVIGFELESSRQLWTWTPPPPFGGVRGVALSPDGGHLLTANGDGTVYIIRMP
jgi:WD40 repeat protein